MINGDDIPIIYIVGISLFWYIIYIYDIYPYDVEE